MQYFAYFKNSSNLFSFWVDMCSCSSAQANGAKVDPTWAFGMSADSPTHTHTHTHRGSDGGNTGRQAGGQEILDEISGKFWKRPRFREPFSSPRILSTSIFLYYGLTTELFFSSVGSATTHFLQGLSGGCSLLFSV